MPLIYIYYFPYVCVSRAVITGYSLFIVTRFPTEWFKDRTDCPFGNHIFPRTHSTFRAPIKRES